MIRSHHLDVQLSALYRAAEALQTAKEYASDELIAARIRVVAHDVMTLIGKLALAANEARVS